MLSAILPLFLAAVFVSTVTLSLAWLLSRGTEKSPEVSCAVGFAGLVVSAFFPPVFIPAFFFWGGSLFPIPSGFSLFFLTACDGERLVLGALATLFAVGFTGEGIRAIVEIVKSRRLMFLAQPLANPETHGRLTRCLEKFPGHVYPVLFTSEAIRFPSIWCWGLHPAILLPKAWIDSWLLTEEETEVIFLHELAHLLRRDHFMALIGRMAGAWLFWNPLYWLMIKRLDLLSDTACDLFALKRSTIRPDNYSELLVRMASGERDRWFYRYFTRKETMMKRISVILAMERSGEKQSDLPPIAKGWTILSFIALTLLAATLSLSLVIPIRAATEESVAATPETPETPAAPDNRPIERFMAERHTMRQNMPKPTEAQIEAAETTLREVQAGYDAGQPDSGPIQLAEAKRKLAELNFAATEDQKYADEVIAAAKLCYDMTKAQFEAGHKSSTAENLCRTEIDWKEAALNFAPLDQTPDIQTVGELLEAADWLERAVQLSVDEGQAASSDIAIAKERAESIRAKFLPIAKELFPKLIREPKITFRSINRPVRDFPVEMDLSTPENAYASYMLLVASEKGAKKARENFLVLHLAATPDEADRFSVSDFEYDPQWGALCRDAKILEVLIYQDRYAQVVAFLPGESVRHPFDVRTLEKVDGRWLNLGNDRFDSLDKFRYRFFRFLPQFEEATRRRAERQKKYEERKARLAAMKSVPDVIITPINRPVSDWPLPIEKTDSPEALYAALKQTLASGDADLIKQLDRFQADSDRIMSPSECDSIVNMEPSFREALRGATILETIVCGNRGMVIAQLAGEGVANRIDVESVRFDPDQGVWLNEGNDRVGTVEAAEMIFAESMDRENSGK